MLSQKKSPQVDNKVPKTGRYNKCNVNFQSQYGYVNGDYIHVSDYEGNKGHKIQCQNGHELIYCSGVKIRDYFRHKHKEDVGGQPMTEWHSRMQSYFPVTEVRLAKTSEHQIRERRTDVFIKDHNYCVEIQHSIIDREKVFCREQDYSLHGLSAIWLIDGNTSDVIFEELSTGFLITFNDDWKYDSYKHTNNFILLDIKDKIFKIPVKNVCNKMILVKEWRPIDHVVKILLTDPKSIWDDWDGDNEIKPKMTQIQKGAGNGKTYGIWKSIAENADKDLFIIVTKQHSAREVIKKELDDQACRCEYHIVNNLHDLDKDKEPINRKFIITYKHEHSSRECIVIISTIDSLIYNLVSPDRAKVDFFAGLLETIEEEGPTKVDEKTGGFSYAGKKLRLNKKTELWIDEAQDLPESYFKSVVRLMIETKIDTMIVGDKLQSLKYQKNFITVAEDEVSHDINIVREIPVNINRRIQVTGMAERINSLVHFEEYDLPPVRVYKEEETAELTFDTIDVPANTTVDVDIILDKVNDEVEKHGYSPNDFLLSFQL